MECESSYCSIDECGSDCSINCFPGHTCKIGKCTDGGCKISPIGSARYPSKLLIEDCPGGNCTIACGYEDTCTIGSCAGGGCTITCPYGVGATCNCSGSGCTVIETR
jgi:hypothetical protein